MISETWAKFGRAVLFAVIISACIVLLLLFFSKFVGVISDGTLLVSVLGILVTALITWQIFNAVENSKTLRKMEDLETKLKDQIKRSGMDTQAVFDFAEAHRLEQEANRSTDFGYQYNCHVRALLLYLRSNMGLSYPPLQNKTSLLNMLISQVSRSENDDNKILFARQMVGLEDLHEEILDEIGKRDKELRRIRREIINLRTRREQLFNAFIGMETSVDKMMREWREEQTRKVNNSETEPPTPSN